MQRRSWLLGIIGISLIALVALAAPAAQPAGPPRLFVLVIFDQLRGDFLQRWYELFTDDGFRRLEREGTWFTNCHYPFAVTYTGPGHASLVTGCSPDRHGIVANDWYDRAAGASVNCATAERYRNVVTDPPAEPVARRERGGTPERLLVPTFADVIKEATGGQAKVVALSYKDRSAILPGGRKPDACYWFENRAGTFCTSTYYRDGPHAWVNDFNRARLVDRWFNRTWDRLRPDLDYAKFSGPDDVAGESTGVARRQGRVFPHPMNAGLTVLGTAYYDTVETSPFGNDLLLDFALRALDAEKLGADDVPDFLSISFSSNDLVGHQYGPDSQEVMDITLRSDLIVRDLLNALDRRVGRGRYVVALSADHGICPLPEVSTAKGIDARRVNPSTLANRAAAFLRQTYHPAEEKTSWIQSQAFPWLYLNHKAITAHGAQPADVAEALAGYLRNQPAVQAMYTRRQIENDLTSDDVLGRQVRKSYHPDRCGDLAMILKPYYLPATSSTGTTHGSPHAYDTHVPLLVLGPGIPIGSSDEEVAPQAVVPIFAQLAGIAPPSSCDTSVPARLREK